MSAYRWCYFCGFVADTPLQLVDHMRERHHGGHYGQSKHADSTAQPAPTGAGKSVTDAVIADLEFRRIRGKEKYGRELLTDNGRDPLIDAYQEAIDLCVYLKQALMERDAAEASREDEAQRYRERDGMG